MSKAASTPEVSVYCKVSGYTESLISFSFFYIFSFRFKVSLILRTPLATILAANHRYKYSSGRFTGCYIVLFTNTPVIVIQLQIQIEIPVASHIYKYPSGHLTSQYFLHWKTIQ